MHLVDQLISAAASIFAALIIAAATIIAAILNKQRKIDTTEFADDLPSKSTFSVYAKSQSRIRASIWLKMRIIGSSILLLFFVIIVLLNLIMYMFFPGRIGSGLTFENLLYLVPIWSFGITGLILWLVGFVVDRIVKVFRAG